MGNSSLVSNSWPLLQHATWPPLVTGVFYPRLTFCKHVGHNAATESPSLGGRDLSVSSHPTVLASQVAWITGESAKSILATQDLGLKVFFKKEILLYSRTKGVKRKYLLYISSIGSGSQVSAIYNVQIYSCSRNSQQGTDTSLLSINPLGRQIGVSNVF